MVSLKVRLAAVAFAGLVVLTGCSHDTDEALRVGDVTLTNAEVDAAAAHVTEALAPEGVTGVTGQVRGSVVELRAFLEVARRYAQEQGVTPDQPDYASAADSLGLPQSDTFVRLNAEASAYLAALLAAATPRDATDEEIRKVYDDFLALTGADPAEATFDQIKDELLGVPNYGQALKLRDELSAAADRYDVVVNPRYQPLTYALLSVSTQSGRLDLVTLPIGEQGTGAVATAK